ncbi:MAG: HAD family hydrolase [Acutalibacteraceae bacterium]
MEKDLSNWLVASDIDGTLNNKFRFMPRANYREIDRFINKFGGNFTLASGRGVESMRPHFEKLPKGKKAPAVIINGAGIYDFENEKLLDFTPVNEQGREVAELVMKKFPGCEIQIITLDQIYTVNPKIIAPLMRSSDPLPNTDFINIEDVPFCEWGKVIFMAMPKTMKKIISFINTLDTDKLSFMSSSVISYEMLGENTNKGTAVLKVAKLLGIDRSHTAAIGDYLNDYEMLKSVGLPACCAQAPEALQEIAAYRACHCNRGAVADLLKHIENLNND